MAATNKNKQAPGRKPAGRSGDGTGGLGLPAPAMAGAGAATAREPYVFTDAEAAAFRRIEASKGRSASELSRSDGEMNGLVTAIKLTRNLPSNWMLNESGTALCPPTKAGSK